MQFGVPHSLADLRHADVARLDQHVGQAERAVRMMIVQHAAAHAVFAPFAIEVRRL